MASVNKLIVVGHIGSDPEIRYTASGDAICNARLATSDQWTDKASGEKRETTEWHRLVFYRKLAEIAQNLLSKGSLCYIEGKLKTRKWTDKEGQERYTTEVEVQELKVFNRKEKIESPRQDSQPSVSDLEDDIPF